MTLLFLLNPLESISWKPGSTISPFECPRLPPQSSGFIVVPYSVSSASSIFREQNDLPTHAARNHTIWTGAPWWPLLESRRTVWIVPELHGNPVGWRTSIHEQLFVTTSLGAVWFSISTWWDGPLQQGWLPQSQKHDVVTPILKRDWARMAFPVSGLSPISLFYLKSSSAW